MTCVRTNTLVLGSSTFKIATMDINDWQNISKLLLQQGKAQYHLENMHKWLELGVRLKAKYCYRIRKQHSKKNLF